MPPLESMPALESMFVSLAEWSIRRGAQVNARVGRAFEQLWLGLLRPSQLQAITDGVYLRDGTTPTRRYNDRGLTKEEACFVDVHFAHARVALFGAGSGRELLAFLDRGIDAWATDCNPELVRAGRSALESRGFNPKRLVEFGPDAPPPSIVAKGPTAVWIGLGAFSHMLSDSGRRAFLSAARGLVPLGAPLLLSFHETATRREGPRKLLRQALAAISRNPRELQSFERLNVGFVRFLRRIDMNLIMKETGWTPTEWVTTNRVTFVLAA